MARIAGVDLPREKRVEIGLTYIYGIGRVSSNRILAEAKVDPNTRVKDLTDEEVGRIKDVIDASQTVEGDLRREIALNIKRLQEIGCYRGIRHRKGLPVRGQKTKTNARTRKGPKKTIANKNTVTILLVLAGVVVLWFFYNMRVKEATTPIKVPYAKEELHATDEITEDKIGMVEVNSKLLKTADIIQNQGAISIIKIKRFERERL